MPWQWQAPALLLLGILLSACSNLSRDPADTVSWEQHRKQLSTLSHWTAAGKLAVRSPGQAESASLLWQQAGTFTHLRLSGPLGVSATTIDSDGQVVQVQQGEQHSSWAIDNPPATHAGPGWDLPLAALPHWLKGVPAPDGEIQSMTLDTGGQRLRELQQAGWTIEYEDYHEFELLQLPTRLSIRRGDTSARLILREWRDLAPQ